MVDLARIIPISAGAFVVVDRQMGSDNAVLLRKDMPVILITIPFISVSAVTGISIFIFVGVPDGVLLRTADIDRRRFLKVMGMADRFREWDSQADEQQHESNNPFDHSLIHYFNSSINIEY
jgi:hypothetical protein